METSCMLMLLLLNLSHWTPSTMVPLKSSPHRIAIALTPVSYTERLHGHHWQQHISVFIHKAWLSKLLRYLTSLVEFRADNHNKRSQERLN